MEKMGKVMATQSTKSQQGVLDRDNCMIKAHHSMQRNEIERESRTYCEEEFSSRNAWMLVMHAYFCLTRTFICLMSALFSGVTCATGIERGDRIIPERWLTIRQH
jgi:hypothetical protein